jgi:hypothetical protein
MRRADALTPRGTAELSVELRKRQSSLPRKKNSTRPLTACCLLSPVGPNLFVPMNGDASLQFACQDSCVSTTSCMADQQKSSSLVGRNVYLFVDDEYASSIEASPHEIWLWVLDKFLRPADNVVLVTVCVQPTEDALSCELLEPPADTTTKLKEAFRLVAEHLSQNSSVSDPFFYSRLLQHDDVRRSSENHMMRAHVCPYCYIMRHATSMRHAQQCNRLAYSMFCSPCADARMY